MFLGGNAHRMYKLIIADDERRIRQGLNNIVDWESLGFQAIMLLHVFFITVPCQSRHFLVKIVDLNDEIDKSPKFFLVFLSKFCYAKLTFRRNVLRYCLFP